MAAETEATYKSVGLRCLSEWVTGWKRRPSDQPTPRSLSPGPGSLWNAAAPLELTQRFGREEGPAIRERLERLVGGLEEEVNLTTPRPAFDEDAHPSCSSLGTTGNSTMTRVPLPALLRMRHLPPSSLARCRMPSRPK